MSRTIPKLFTRDEALARIRTEGDSPACLMCAVRDRRVGATYAVYEDDDVLVILPRYVRRWGHLHAAQTHVTTYTGVTPRCGPGSMPTRSTPRRCSRRSARRCGST